MENYIVSARKYRPDNFESVVGQDSITQTLKNAIKSNQLAQAYLFCGPRGVGKTTCARIFAKTINCSNISENNEACNECESCVAFNSQRSLNIRELDAASNNSVDDIRNLIDQVRIPPQIGSYSVYIIDEVHMLSKSAFNAFLKTLEEPPSHAIFILATTEKYKILPTILSRCQIFDFNRISVDDIRDRLDFVAKHEEISAEQDALHIMAQKADGAMRDALSIFDQIVSFSGKNITYDNTILNLNVLDYDIYFNITNAFLIGDYTNSLLIFDSVLRKGFEGNYFILGLASHFRDLLVCKDPGTIELLEVGEKIKTKYLEHSQKCSVPFLFKAIEFANKCDLNYKQSHNKKLLVELALLGISSITNKSDLTAETTIITEKPIIEKTKEQENKVKEVKITPEIKTEEKPITISGKQEDDKIKSEIESKKDVVEEIKPVVEEKTTPIINKESSYDKKPITGISIKDIANKTNKTEETIDESGEPVVSYSDIGTDSYTEEKFKYAWSKYAELFSNQPRLHSYLRGHVPTKQSENKYIITVDTEAIKKRLDKDLVKTVNFMKKELNNKNFELEYVIGKTEEKTSFKTQEEKLKDMIKENPEVGNLRDRLNLDFE